MPKKGKLVGGYRIMVQRNYFGMISDEEKAQYIADIDKEIHEWTNETNGILIKSDRDRYRRR